MEGAFSDQEEDHCQNALNLFTQQNTNVSALFNEAEILSCSKQVVAGFNYKLSLKLSSGEQCSITLYKDLQDNVSVNDNYEDTCSQMAASS